MRTLAVRFKKLLTSFSRGSNESKHLISKDKEVLSFATKPEDIGLTVEKTVKEGAKIEEKATAVLSAASREKYFGKTDNIYNLLDEPFKHISPMSEEEFIVYLNSKKLPQEEQKALVELFRTGNKTHVQYLSNLNIMKDGKVQSRFTAAQIKELSELLQRNEEYTLSRINKVNENGQPHYSFDIIKMLVNGMETNPWLTQFFTENHFTVSSYKNVMEIYKTNPKRYQEMVDSGIFELIAKNKTKKNELLLEIIGKNKYLSRNVLKDARKIADNKPLVVQIPAGAKLEEISKFVEEGEVGVREGKLYANQSGKAIELNFTQEKYEEMFPLLDRFAFYQGHLGDCGLISSMYKMLSEPHSRIDVFKMISQDGQDILINYPLFNRTLRFRNGVHFDVGVHGVAAPNGPRMLEQSFIFCRKNGLKQISSDSGKEIDVVRELSQNPSLMQCLERTHYPEFIEAVTLKQKTWTESMVSAFKGLVEVFKELPAEFSSKKARKILLNKLSNPNGHTGYEIWIPEKHYKDGIISTEYDLQTPHAYSFVDYNPWTQIATICNPQDTGAEIEVPLKTLLEYGKMCFL